jgi:hypothetical protein
VTEEQSGADDQVLHLNTDNYPKPQNAVGADAPGSYQHAARTTTRETQSGGEIQLIVNITGYGRIEGCKLAFYPPPYFIDDTRSTVKYGLGKNSDGDLVFGFDETSLDGDATVMNLSSGGIKPPHWGHASLFFDQTSTRTASPSAHDCHRGASACCASDLSPQGS